MKGLLTLFALCLVLPAQGWAFDRADLVATLKDRNCQHCDLSGADLSTADLSRGNFVGSDFTFANLKETNFSGANLKGAKFGFDFFMPLTPAKAPADSTSTEANSAMERLGARQLKGGQVFALWDNSYVKIILSQGTQITEANFSGANLEGANFVACNLNNAQFDNTFLKDADFSYARLNKANFSEAFAKDALFYKADLHSTLFAQADLSGALLYKAEYETSMAAIYFKQTKLGGALDMVGKLCKEGSLGRCD
ncbi:MAG: pentapeptide repeat-containing protein [bacterium]|nr:pentapeptide repeat-containing protein [bacterium]